ncbi:MAG TPA: hypothetical protein VFV87_14700 [Pirellulaceae bacterium]|nr:hypothetical protein [Pirellulaceae bacterium]
MSLSRREFARQSLGGLLTYSLLQTLFSRDAFGDEMKLVAAKWLKDLNDLSQEAKSGKLKQTDWQTKVDELFDKIDLAEALQFIDFEKLTANLKFRDQGELSLRAKLPQVEGLPTDLVFGHQVFALTKDRSVVPHGHNNMATAFLILKGTFRGRHYDRLEDDGEYMIIRPTIDRAFGPTEHSTVSDYKDNVHWFTATSDQAFIFNIHVMNVDPAKKNTGRVYIDPSGEKLSDNRIRARRVSAGEVYKLYG